MKPTLDETQQHLIRHRTVQRRLRAANVNTRQYEVFSCGGPGNVYCQADTMKFALKLAEAEAWQSPGTIMSIWSPLRCHCHQAVVEQGQYKIIHPTGALHQARFDTPEQLVDELIRYIGTTDNLREQLRLVSLNQANLMANGVYDGQTAFKAFWPVADDAVDQYKQQYGGTGQEQFPHDIRQMTAEKLARLFEQERREDPERFVEQYVEPQLDAKDSGQQQIQIDSDPDGKTIIINIGAKQSEEPK